MQAPGSSTAVTKRHARTTHRCSRCSIDDIEGFEVYFLLNAALHIFMESAILLDLCHCCAALELAHIHELQLSRGIAGTGTTNGA
jgi:hypothetical protein